MMKFARRAVFGLLVLALFVFLVFPFYYAFLTSFSSGSALFDVSWWPQSVDPSNYVRVFTQQPFGRNLLNSASLQIRVGKLRSLTRG